MSFKVWSAVILQQMYVAHTIWVTVVLPFFVSQKMLGDSDDIYVDLWIIPLDNKQ